MRRNLVLLCFLALLVGACQNLTKQYARIPDSASAAIQPVNCRILVYRERAVVGTAPIFINDSGTPIGDLFIGGYLVWDRPAGHGVIRAKLQLNQDPDAQESEFVAGQTYHFLARLVPGHVGTNSRASIVPMDEAAAARIRATLSRPIN